MRLYVMSRYGNLERVQRFIDDALAAGHEITHDWTRHEDDGTDDAIWGDPVLCTRFAVSDLEEGVRPAELLVFLADTPEFCGSLIEFGYGMAHGISAWVVAPWRKSIFWRLPGVEIVDSEEIARQRLGMAALREAA